MKLLSAPARLVEGGLPSAVCGHDCQQMYPPDTPGISHSARPGTSPVLNRRVHRVALSSGSYQSVQSLWTIHSAHSQWQE